MSPTKSLNASHQGDVNALVVHCSTSWSITGTPEEVHVDKKGKKERRRMARRRMLLGRASYLDRGMKERGGNLVTQSHFMFWRDECSGFGEAFVRAKKRTVPQNTHYSSLTRRHGTCPYFELATGPRSERVYVHEAERSYWLSEVKMYHHIVTVVVISSYRPRPAVANIGGSGTTSLHTDVSLNRASLCLWFFEPLREHGIVPGRQ